MPGPETRDGRCVHPARAPGHRDCGRHRGHASAAAAICAASSERRGVVSSVMVGFPCKGRCRFAMFGRASESFARCLARLTTNSADAGPHGMEEQADAAELSKPGTHDQPAKRHAVHAFPCELPRRAYCRADGQQPVRDVDHPRTVARVVLVRAGKRTRARPPESSPMTKPTKISSNACARCVSNSVGARPRKLAAHQHPPARARCQRREK